MILAWDLGVNLLVIPNFVTRWAKKKIVLNFGLKGVMEKCVGCLLVYPF